MGKTPNAEDVSQGRNPRREAEDYCARMCLPSPHSLEDVRECNWTSGLVELVSSALEREHWEIGQQLCLIPVLLYVFNMLTLGRYITFLLVNECAGILRRIIGPFRARAD
jgi:hypothetical protein